MTEAPSTEAPGTEARTAEIILFPSRRVSGQPRAGGRTGPRVDREPKPPSLPSPDRASVGRAERRRPAPPESSAPQILPPLRLEAAQPASARGAAASVLTPRSSAEVSISHDRLQCAMNRLNAALTSQREAVAAWRQSLAELQSSLSGLSGGLHRYRDRLVAVGQGVERLGGEARRLEAWAQAVDLPPGR